MKFCSKCGNQINDDAVVCLNCGCAVEHISEDKSNIGLGILGFFFPLAGLIIYIVLNDKTPLKAKSAGKGALIGFIIKVVVCILWAVFVGATTASYLSSLPDIYDSLI